MMFPQARFLAVALIVAGLWYSPAVAKSALRDDTYSSLGGNDGRNTCIRLMDVNGAIGCSSPEDGAKGVLFHIANQADLDAFENGPKRDYIAILSQDMFASNETMSRLLATSRFKGAFVYGDGDSPFSPDKSIPNENHGLAFDTSSGSKPVPRNTAGGGYGKGMQDGLHWQDLGDRPIFAMRDDDFDFVMERYNETNLVDSVNQKYPDFPLLSAKLNDFMWGVNDAELCLRRKQCDPLKSNNLWATMRPLQSYEETVMVTAQLDALAFFHDKAYGANADASGLIALLAAAHLLGDPANSAIREAQRNIMFVLLNGETVGYVGSSKLGYDMTHDIPTFPSSRVKLHLDNVTHYLELSQLMTGDDSFYTYALDPAASPASQEIATKLSDAFDAIPEFVTDKPNVQLPASSLRGLLNEIRDENKRNAFGGVVLTDFDENGYKNMFYNSRLDDYDNINQTPDSVQKICHVASAVAKTIWALATDSAVADVNMPKNETDCELVQELVTCITKDQNCTLVDDVMRFVTRKGEPIPRYVGVVGGNNLLTRPVAFFFNVLGEAVAIDRNVTAADGTPLSNCSSEGFPPDYQYLRWHDGRCVKSAIFTHTAISPAFDGYSVKPIGTPENKYRDGRDPRWSTWTESVWGQLSARVYMAESHTAQLATFFGGFSWIILSFVFVAAMRHFFVEEIMPSSDL